MELACLCKKLISLNNGDSLAVFDQESGQLLEHHELHMDPRYKDVWDCSYSNKLGRLCQGIGTGDKAGGKWVAGTSTLNLIPYLDISHHKPKKIIYTKVVCEKWEGKDDENCTKITVGGNLIYYPSNAGTNTASLELVKLMLNSAISCKRAQFACINIKNFYLDTPVVDPEYVRIKTTDIPEEFMLEYGLAWKKITIGGSTLKYNVAAIGYPRLVYLQPTSFKGD